jgi:hypothetical protein
MAKVNTTKPNTTAGEAGAKVKHLEIEKAKAVLNEAARKEAAQVEKEFNDAYKKHVQPILDKAGYAMTIRGAFQGGQIDAGMVLIKKPQN